VADCCLTSVGGNRCLISSVLPCTHWNPRRRMATSTSSTDEWELYYWPKMLGRGEFARLLFAETGTPYKEMYQGLGGDKAWPQLQQMKQSKPFFACPLIRHTPPSSSSSPVLLTQVAVIVRYLAAQLDNGRLAAKAGVDDYYATEVVANVVDVVAEGHDAWHAINHSGSYESQKKETQPFIEKFIQQRLPKWAQYFEDTLIAAGGHYFIGHQLSYVDLCVFHWLDGIEYQLPKEYASLPIPTLRAFKEQIASRPAIANRLKTRKETYDGTGPIF